MPLIRAKERIKTAPVDTMTKRELFAIEMMKVLVALPGAGTGVYDESVRRNARMAVEHADALLEELAKSKEVQP